MTRKDFKLIASVLKRAPATPDTAVLILDFAEELLRTYPLFSWDKFMTACEHGTGQLPQESTHTPPPKYVVQATDRMDLWIFPNWIVIEDGSGMKILGHFLNKEDAQAKADTLNQEADDE